jgi:signal transduction histidine kinase
VRTALDRVATGAGPLVDHTTIAGHSYLVRTERHRDAVVQAVLDLRYRTEDRTGLLRALILAEAAGLLAALLIGQILARRAIAPLGEALARQRRFVADASHELRTPLTRLHTRAQLVARRLRGSADPVVEDVDRLVTGTRQLGEVVEDLLVSAQFRQLRQAYGPVDLGALAEELVLAESARAEALGVTIEVRLDESGDHLVHGAKSPLRRVISALLDNALGHTGFGGHVWVTVAEGKGGRMVELSVRDDGVGFDPHDTTRLFSRFVTGAHGDGPRFGLGLALVREVVDGHGGTITADGRPGTGATFTVRLPILG